MQQFCTQSKNYILGIFWPKFAQKKIYFENRAPSIFGHCHFASLCQISAKHIESIPRKTGKWKVVNRNFTKKKFWEKLFWPYFRTYCPLSFCQKLEKTNEAILHKVQKTLFLGGFWPKFAQKNFFPKFGLRHILGVAILHLCAKNQQKIMSQSPEKLVTDARTDGRTDGQRLN